MLAAAARIKASSGIETLSNTPQEWAAARRVTLTYQGRPIEFLGKHMLNLGVKRGRTHLGNLVKRLGHPWEFIPKSFEVPNLEGLGKQFPDL